MIIAIDGPAGSGKSTLAKLLAKKLNILFIDTGAMYRALTLKAIQEKIDLNNGQGLADLLRVTKIDLKANQKDSTLAVFLDSKEVTEAIRAPEITRKVMFIARQRQLREEMVKKQRELARGKDAVLEGRDIGTVVFPSADKKFYLDASIEQRAQRRQKDLINAGHKTALEELREEIEARDASDIEREFAPLKKAGDALYIDTTQMTIEQVCQVMLKEIKQNE